jgi:hypothetical protein
MLFKQIVPLLVLAANLFGLTVAKRGKNPGPTCGAPFCGKKDVSMTGPPVTATSSTTVVVTSTMTAAPLRV